MIDLRVESDVKIHQELLKLISGIAFRCMYSWHLLRSQSIRQLRGNRCVYTSRWSHAVWLLRSITCQRLSSNEWSIGQFNANKTYNETLARISLGGEENQIRRNGPKSYSTFFSKHLYSLVIKRKWTRSVRLLRVNKYCVFNESETFFVIIPMHSKLNNRNELKLNQFMNKSIYVTIPAAKFQVFSVVAFCTLASHTYSFT